MSFLPEPVRCRPEAYELLAAQTDSLESPEALITGAVAIAMHVIASADPADVHAQLDDLADRIMLRVHSDHPQALLAHAHALLFEEEGFAGNTEDYFSPHNSFLPSVLTTRRGIPVTLSLVYKAVVERLGLRVFGINAPGHFLAAVELPNEGDLMVVDPYFLGRILTAEEAIVRAEHVLGHGITDPAAVLPAASNAQWLMRILTNLYHIFAQAQRYEDMAAMSEMRQLLEGR